MKAIKFKMSALLLIVLSATTTAQNAQFNWASTYQAASGSSKSNGMVWSTPGVGHHLVTCGEYTGTVDADLTSGSTLLTSQGNTDIFISRCDGLTGALGWAISIGSNGDDKALVIERASDYNILVGGSFSGTVDFDAGPGVNNLTSAGGTDGFLMKIDITNGNLIWVRHAASGSGNEAVMSVSRNFTDFITLAGIFNTTTDVNPGTSVDYVTTSGGNDIFVAQYDASGNYLRGTSFGGADNDILYAAAQGTYGSSLIAGAVYSQIDLDPSSSNQVISTSDTTLFVVSLDTALAYFNHVVFNNVKTGTVAYDNNIGGIFIAGTFRDSVDTELTAGTNYLYSNGGTDIFVVSTWENLSSSGLPLSYGGSSDEVLHSFSSDAGPNVTLTGLTTSMDFQIPNPPADTLTFNLTGNDIFAYTVDFNSGVISNSGVIANGNANRKAMAGICKFGWTGGYEIWVAGNVSGSCDYDPTPTTAIVNTVSLINEAFVLAWSPCSTITVGTGNTLCDTFFIYNNNVYPVPGVFYDTLTSMCGSDSIVQWTLYLQPAPDTGVTISGNAIVSDQGNASYQWVDCNANYASIPGANSQSFTPSVNGSYAVIVSTASCNSDTSACITYSLIGIEEYNELGIVATPNPFNENLQLKNLPESCNVSLINALGQNVHSVDLQTQEHVLNTSHLPSGVYMLHVQSSGMTSVIRLIK